MSCLLLRFAPLLLLVVCVVCVPPGSVDSHRPTCGDPSDPCDVGDPEGNEPSFEAGLEDSGGFEETLTPPPECTQLQERVCGAGECEDAPACAAAILLFRYEPEACAAALTNEVTYPSCRPGVCALLVDKVCGDVSPAAPCEGAVGCSPSRELWRRSIEGSAEERRDAESSCGAALEDELVFAVCL
jgi:hypothetical protein